MTQVDTAYRLRLIPTPPGFVCDVPGELPDEFVEPKFGRLELVELEFVESEFAEPEFVVVGSGPGFALAGLEPGFDVAGFVEPAVPGALPGSVPHGDPRGAVSGLFVVFGFTVEGDVPVPGVAGAGEFDPGMLPGEVAFGDDPFGRRCGDISGVVCGVSRLCRRSRCRSRWCCGLGWWCRGLGWWCRGLGRRSRRARRTLGHRPSPTATEYE